jgi:hypothetical protein
MAIQIIIMQSKMHQSTELVVASDKNMDKLAGGE